MRQERQLPVGTSNGGLGDSEALHLTKPFAKTRLDSKHSENSVHVEICDNKIHVKMAAVQVN